METPKIILINPNYQSDIFTIPSLPVGLGYIAQSLEDHNIPYLLIDLNIDSEDLLYKLLKDKHVQYVGISMMSYRAKESYNLAKRIKSISPNTIVIVGGPHVIAESTNIFYECTGIDICVVGEGELTLLEILNSKHLDSISGIMYRHENDIICTKQKHFLDIKIINFPKYTGFKLHAYANVMPLNSSRGCIYKCIFCGAPKFLGNKNRRQTAENMFKEFLYWYKHGYKKFKFTDSLFCLDKKRIESFCDLIITGKYDVEFSADGVRADNIDYKMLLKMKEANFICISFGVESATNKMLECYKKGVTIEQIEETLFQCYKLDIPVGLFFIIGGPSETVHDVKSSFRFALKYPNVSFAYFFKLTPIPGTSYFVYALEKGYINEDTKYPTGNFGFEENVNISNDSMSIKEFNRMLKSARKIVLSHTDYV